MRTIMIGLLAAAGIALAIPAHAEDTYIGVGVRDHDHGWRHHYARERDEVVVRGHRDCRVTIIHEDGMTKRIKRCRD